MRSSATRTALRYAAVTGLAILGFDLAADLLLAGQPGPFAALHVVLALGTFPLLFLVLRYDLMARERAEAQGRLSDRRLAHLLDTTTNAILSVDAEARILALNQAAQRLLGAGVADALGQPLLLRLPSGQDHAISLDEQFPTQGQRQEVVARRPDRSEFAAEASVSRLVQDGQVTFTVILNDITRRKRAEADLQQERNRLKSILDAMNDGVVITSAQGQVEYLNRVMEQSFGPLLGQSCTQAFHNGVEVCPACRNDDVLAGRSVRWQWLSSQLGKVYDVFDTPLTNADGTVSKLQVFHDITARERIESELRASEEQFRQLAEHIHEVFWIAVPNHSRFLYVSPAYEQMLGRPVAELYANAALLVQAVAADDRLRVGAALHAGVEFDEECRVTGADGVRRWLRLRGFPIRHEMGGVYRMAGLADDITERVQAYQLLEQRVEERTRELYVQAQHLAALEERQRLARDLHDSLSQSLYGIALGTHTALTFVDTSRERTIKALDYVLGLADASLVEMRALIFELRPESLVKEGLTGALTRQIAAVRARHGLAVEAEVCGEPDLALPAKEALYRIAQEALHNAVRHAQAQSAHVRLVCYPEAVMLAVADDGVGFDPAGDFDGHLGLRSMRERATRLGGRLTIDSRPGQGTRIEVHLPRMGVPAAAHEA